MTPRTIAYERQTAAFININPIYVSLERRKKVATSGGGYKWVTDHFIPLQKCRQVFSGNVSDRMRRTLPDGRIATVESTLVFLRDADVQEGDIARFNEQTYEVARVMTKYAKDAELIRYG